MAPNPVMTEILIRGEIWTQTEERQLKTQGKNRLLQTKEKGLEHIFPYALRESHPCQHFNFGVLASRAIRKYISIVWATQSVVPCYVRPRKLLQQLPHTYQAQKSLLELKLDLFFGMEQVLLKRPNCRNSAQ